MREGWGHLSRGKPGLAGSTQTFRVSPGAITPLLCDVDTLSFPTSRQIGTALSHRVAMRIRPTRGLKTPKPCTRCRTAAP